MVDDLSQFEFLTCGECGIRFAAPKRFIEARRAGDQKVSTFYCPNGHPRQFRETELDAVRRERDRLIQEKARLDDERRDAERRLSQEQQKRVRLEKRAAAGVCPCCNRTVSQLARHMQSQHPETPYVPKKAKPSAVREARLKRSKADQ